MLFTPRSDEWKTEREAPANARGLSELAQSRRMGGAWNHGPVGPGGGKEGGGTAPAMKSVQDVRPGDTIHDGMGRPMIHVTRVDNARAPGYKVATGIAGTHPPSDSGNTPGRPMQQALGHGSRQLPVSTGHSDHPSNAAPAAPGHNAGLGTAMGRTFNPEASRTVGNMESNVARVSGAQKGAIDAHLQGAGYTKGLGRAKNETTYSHPDGHVVSVTNQGKSGLLVNSVTAHPTSRSKK